MKIVCDRCNTIYMEGEDTEIRFSLDEIGWESELHLCPFCKNLLLQWMGEIKAKAKKND